MEISLTALLKILDTWSEWKRLKALPAELDALKQRVAMLERAPAAAGEDQCPSCRGLSYRLIESTPDRVMGDLGINQHRFRCSSCGYERVTKDSGRR